MSKSIKRISIIKLKLMGVTNTGGFPRLMKAEPLANIYLCLAGLYVSNKALM